MRLPTPLFSRLRPLAVSLATVAIVTLFSACGGYAHRSQSALSEHDRAVLADYEQIRAGLAADNPRAARNGAVAMVEELKKSGDSPSTRHLLAEVQALVDAKALDAQRQNFQMLSVSLVPVAAGVDGYYIMASPAGLGGDWIQRTPDVDNPYLGSVMHSYGSLKK